MPRNPFQQPPIAKRARIIDTVWLVFATRATANLQPLHGCPLDVNCRNLTYSCCFIPFRAMA
ncbi:hypothetical protein [Nostoc sp.]|uniref:hypothetical protein n=1 Tax=Nostoc sp. TaxID=1180 RepID=UPI002FF802C0